MLIIRLQYLQIIHHENYFDKHDMKNPHKEDKFRSPTEKKNKNRGKQYKHFYNEITQQ